MYFQTELDDSPTGLKDVGRRTTPLIFVADNRLDNDCIVVGFTMTVHIDFIK